MKTLLPVASWCIQRKHPQSLYSYIIEIIYKTTYLYLAHYGVPPCTDQCTKSNTKGHRSIQGLRWRNSLPHGSYCPRFVLRMGTRDTVPMVNWRAPETSATTRLIKHLEARFKCSANHYNIAVMAVYQLQVSEIITFIWIDKPIYSHNHWIGLRENLQETMVFTIKYRAFL